MRDTIPSGAVLVAVPFSGVDASRVLLWQADAGLRFRTPEGFAIVPSSSYDSVPSPLFDVLAGIEAGRPAPPLTSDLRRRLETEVRRLGVDVVVVDPTRAPASTTFLTDLLGVPARRLDGVLVWYNVAEHAGGHR